MRGNKFNIIDWQGMPRTRNGYSERRPHTILKFWAFLAAIIEKILKNQIPKKKPWVSKSLEKRKE